MIGPAIYEVSKIGNGRLSVMAKPVAGEWINDEFAAIHIYGVRHVLSLLENVEAHQVGLEKEEAICEAHGIRFSNLAIADRGVPDDEVEFAKTIKTILKEIKSGTDLVVHCRAGIGRTGLVAAAVLVANGSKVDEAFEKVSEARGVEVPDTNEQKEFVIRLQTYLHAS